MIATKTTKEIKGMMHTSDDSKLWVSLDELKKELDSFEKFIFHNDDVSPVAYRQIIKYLENREGFFAHMGLRYVCFMGAFTLFVFLLIYYLIARLI